MDVLNLSEVLKNNEYPGRGIVIGKSKDGENAVIAYFIMGRSENSRNRIFVKDGDGIRTEAYDKNKLKDPSLIIYSPVRVYNNHFTIVTNGDQTDTIFNFLEKGKTFEDALNTREFEPDVPNFTPRISGGIYCDYARNVFTYKLSILKSSNEKGEGCSRFYFNYTPQNSVGHLIHTYKCNGEPIPSFCGEPIAVSIDDDIDIFTDMLWNSLNADNKVSLFTRYISLKTGNAQDRIVNKNK